MREKEIEKLKEGDKLECANCKAELIHLADDIYFVRGISVIGRDSNILLNDELLQPLCSNCYENIFGDD